MGYALFAIFAAFSMAGFVFILRNFRRQKDFEGTGRIPPEDYD